MREILFRGKRIDNGEWVQGYLTQYSGTTQNGKTFIDSFIQTSHYDHAELVKTDTIGQYTGLTDKNGKKIFEGDIYSWKDDLGGYHACLICFGEYFDRYAHRYATMANGFFVKTLKGETFNFAGAGYSEIEISGNIHDNPELIKGANV